MKPRELSNMKRKGGPGFVLRGTIRGWVKKGELAEGKYFYTWTPRGIWKEEVELPGYKRTKSGDGTTQWQVRSSESESPSGIELDALLNRSRAPLTQSDTKLERIQLKSATGTKPDCIRMTRGVSMGAYCFDPATDDLVEVYTGHNSQDIPWRVEWQQQMNFLEWSGKRIPRLLRGFNGDQLVLEVRLDEIKPLANVPDEFFNKPAEAAVWADCDEGAIWKLKDRVPPEYPHEARMLRRQGTVILHAVIGEDGRISGLKPVHSPWPELYQSAAAAVSHWRYERTSACAVSKGRTETYIDVVYSLNP